MTRGLTIAGMSGLVIGFLACSPSSHPSSVWIPRGTFLQGSEEAPDGAPAAPSPGKALRPHELQEIRARAGWDHPEERPAHQVKLGAFGMDRDEVTNSRYRAFIADVEGEHGHRSCHPTEPGGKDHSPRYWGHWNPLLADASYAATAPFSESTFLGPEQPVVGVDWWDAWAFAHWDGGRLPTEAEWERACRGDDGRRWPWGNDWVWGLANIGGERQGRDVPSKGAERDGFIYVAPVGSFPGGESPGGCRDMAGNASEWVADRWDPMAYSSASERDPKGPPDPVETLGNSERVVRGGDSASAPSTVRCASRRHREPGFRSFTLGFRCARSR